MLRKSPSRLQRDLARSIPMRPPSTSAPGCMWRPSRPAAIPSRCAPSAPSRVTCSASPTGLSSAKTDVCDAQWLQPLHEYGLLRASFQPQGEIATLRSSLRQRERLLEAAAAHIQHMQKALIQMNLQLQHVVADITGQTGPRIIRAMVAGERDPDRLAALRDGRCKAPST